LLRVTDRAKRLREAVLAAPVPLGLKDRGERGLALGTHRAEHTVLAELRRATRGRWELRGRLLYGRLPLFTPEEEQQREAPTRETRDHSLPLRRAHDLEVRIALQALGLGETVLLAPVSGGLERRNEIRIAARALALRYLVLSTPVLVRPRLGVRRRMRSDVRSGNGLGLLVGLLGTSNGESEDDGRKNETNELRHDGFSKDKVGAAARTE
jgi:hypothetical protein